MECKFCAGRCVRNGFQINGKQRYKCKNCNKRQLLNYTYNAYMASTDEKIISFTKEGLGIRSTARLGTNRIERKNLSLRIHLKRLNRPHDLFQQKQVSIDRDTENLLLALILFI